MPKVVFLSDIGRSDDLYRAEVLRVGHWDYPDLSGGLSITPELLSELAANFQAGFKGWEVPLNREHDDERPVGWVKGLEVEGDGLYALFEITDSETRGLVDDGSLKYCSSELDLAWFDPEAKREMPVFEGLALTNRPYIKRLAPVAPVNRDDANPSLALPRLGEGDSGAGI